MMHDELISVIVPVYKTEKLLPACIESILRQKYSNMEIFLVDDGSPDRCGEICDQYAGRDKRIRVLHQINGGVSAARNAALRMAKGKYICFADSDDTVKEEWLSTLYAHMSPGGLSICGFTEIYADRKVDCVKELGNETLTFMQAIKVMLEPDGYRGYVSNKMFDADVVRRNGFEFNCGLKVWEDVMFVSEYMRVAERISYTPLSVYNYYINPLSAIHKGVDDKKIQSTENVLTVLEKIYGLLENENTELLQNIKSEIARHGLNVFRFIACAPKDKNYQEHVKEMMKVLRQYGNAERLSPKERIMIDFVCANPETAFLIYRFWHRKSNVYFQIH